MALAEYTRDLEMCCTCSCCKFIPLEKVKTLDHSWVCPSIARYSHNSYSAFGRLSMARYFLEGELAPTDKLREIVYNCQMCGACDISCKYAMDMDVIDPINEMRISLVEGGHTLPVLDEMVTNMRAHGRMTPAAEGNRGTWAKDLDVKDISMGGAEVLFHAGCRASFDKDLWKAAQASVRLLQKAGVDVAIAGAKETCCGGRAYQMGYKEDALAQAAKNMKRLREWGVQVLVTGCAECYSAFKVLYDKFGVKGDLKVLHMSEYLASLLEEGRLTPVKNVDMRVTYQDPCRLGRLGESYIQWEGREIEGNVRLFDPPREFMRGTYGVYEPPRSVLKSVPGVNLVEMDRTKEYAWCCGAGGGVAESNPEFANWTAKERIAEAESTGAQAIITACPGCQRLFSDAIRTSGSSLEVLDLVEVVEQAL